MPDVIIGLFAGGILGVLAHACTNNYENQATDLITECQAELPRNQHCILQAVPQPILGD